MLTLDYGKPGPPGIIAIARFLHWLAVAPFANNFLIVDCGTGKVQADFTLSGPASPRHSLVLTPSGKSMLLVEAVNGAVQISKADFGKKEISKPLKMELAGQVEHVSAQSNGKICLLSISLQKQGGYLYSAIPLPKD